MAGAGGQFTMIIPSHDLVVVRLGHYRGSREGTQALSRSLGILMDAVPRK
jgi:CubicO group peptidase (beta-lactamase class C family)